jgi:branched-subunit amino acid aminotransferase/4-amino-4-deoxychorismate lyase
MAHVFLNGRLVPEEEARISAQDRAILFGDAAYETMRSYGGRFFRFPEHLRRLRHTLEGMALDLPMSDAEITRGAEQLIEVDGIPEARLRLTVTGGKFGGEIRLRRSHPPQVIMTASALVPPPRSAYNEGVLVRLSPWTVPGNSPLPRIKTVNRLAHLMAKEAALQSGAWESLFVDDIGGILEGTATNVLFVIRDTLRTADLHGPLLAGVTRDAVLECAVDLGIRVLEGRVGDEEIEDASEAFLTSTTIELLPIRAIDKEVIGDGRPGPVWARLWRRYRETVTRETGVALPL